MAVHAAATLIEAVSIVDAHPQAAEIGGECGAILRAEPADAMPAALVLDPQGDGVFGEGAADIPHFDHICLKEDSETGQQQLFDRALNIRMELETSEAAKWELRFQEEGYDYLSHPDVESMWLSEALAERLCRSSPANGSFLLVSQTDVDSTCLELEVEWRKLSTFNFPFQSRRPESYQPIARLFTPSIPVEGASVFWKAADAIQATMGDSPRTLSALVRDKWRPWCNLAAASGLPETHLQRQTCKGYASEQRCSKSGMRLFPYSACSTQLFILILLQLATAKHQETSSSGNTLLESLLTPFS